METSQQITDKARELQARIAPQLDEARKNLSDLNSRITTYVRQNPGTSLLAAVAAGFLFGKIVSRRW